MSDQYYKVFLYGSVNSAGGHYDHPVEIMDNSMPDMVLINPKVNLAADEAGSFDFTIPKKHVFYDAIIPYGSTIAVKEDDSIIFVGRPLPPRIDIWGQKTFHCEGAFAFLNDIVLPHQEVPDQITAADYFDNTLTYYNQIAGRPDRQFFFNFDNPDFQNAVIYDPDPWDCQTVFEFIRDYLHQFVSGHFYVQYIDFDELELKWFRDFDDNTYYDIPGNNQPVQIMINLTDIELIGSEFYTAAIAKGGEDSDGNTPYMTEPVINTPMAEKYGVICKKLEYPDIKVADALEAMCDTFVHNMQFGGFSFKASAADQHPLDPRFDQYKILQKIRVNVEQLGVSVVLPISRIEISLVSAVKYINVGLIDTVPLTISIAKNLEEEKQESKEEAKKQIKKEKNNPKTPSDNPVIRGDDGNDYVLTVEDQKPVVKKIPTNIKISPTLYNYTVGSSLRLSDFTVTAQYGDGTSKNVTSSCTFNIANGYTFVSNDPHYQLTATYKEYGKSYAASARLMPTEESGDFTARPDSLVSTAGAILSETTGGNYIKSNSEKAAVLIGFNSQYDTPNDSHWYTLYIVSTSRNACNWSSPTGLGIKEYNVDGHTVYLNTAGVRIDAGFSYTNPLGLPIVSDVPLSRYRYHPDDHELGNILNILRWQFLSNSSGSGSGSGYSDDSGGSESGGGGHF